MPIIILLIILVGSTVIVFILMLVKNILGPRKIEQLLDLVNQNKTALVIKYAKRLIAKDPRNTTIHFILGNAYITEKNYDLALVEFRAINLIGVFDPKYCPEVPFRKKIAELFLRFEQIDEALKEYLLLVQLEPFNPQHYFNAGKLFEERHTNETAIQYYEKTLEVDKQHSDAHFHLGHLYYRQKKMIEARTELEAAIKIDPEKYGAHFYLGKILKDTHDFSSALFHFEEALKEPELRIKATVEKGSTYFFLGKFEKAIPELQRAITLTADESSNDSLYARYYLGQCFENVRDIERAIEQWEKIYQKKPTFLDVPGKLSQYQELRIDDKIKDYLTVKDADFVKLCKIVVTAMNLQIREITELVNCCQIIAVEAESKWRNARKLPRLIRFYRISEIIKDATVRQISEEMKKLNVKRCVIFSTSGFTKLAYDFAETRPIDLFGKEKLQELLSASEIK
ncbi:MAG: tetratricopeptide repeat protein [Spirochaetales bacterium]|nr:tetratricopeptide repeat protein [Spirochaetales bacterium]